MRMRMKMRKLMKLGVQDEDHRYGSEEENYEMKTKEKPLGPPLELEVPLQPPPALPEK
ncbi:hypothetical protein HN51_031474, partial [Arachis hypogaea]